MVGIYLDGFSKNSVTGTIGTPYLIALSTLVDLAPTFGTNNIVASFVIPALSSQSISVNLLITSANAGSLNPENLILY